MNKAFITKLPVTIENSNIPYLGECVIHVKAGSSYFYMDTEKDVKVWFDKSTNYRIESTTIGNETTGASCIVPAKKRLTVTIPADGLDIIVSKKYDITMLTTAGAFSVKADDVKYMTDLKILQRNDHTGNVELIGDLSALSGLTQITTLCIRNDSNTLTGDLSALSGLTQITGLYIRNDSNTLTGDLSALTNLNKLTDCRLYSFNVTGDLSKMSKICNFCDVYPNKLTWTKGNRTNATIMTNAIATAWNLGDDVDNMLIDQATCTKAKSESDSIRVKGNRTSASDNALSALQNKGITVTILN